MRHEEYRAMFDLEDRLWWYEGMRAVTASILDPFLSATSNLRLLDVGCGTGYSLKWLGERLGTQATFGVDVSPHAAVFWKERGLDNAAVASVHQLPLASDAFDLDTIKSTSPFRRRISDIWKRAPRWLAVASARSISDRPASGCPARASASPSRAVK